MKIQDHKWIPREAKDLEETEETEKLQQPQLWVVEELSCSVTSLSVRALLRARRSPPQPQ